MTEVKLKEINYVTVEIDDNNAKDFYDVITEASERLQNAEGTYGPTPRYEVDHIEGIGSSEFLYKLNKACKVAYNYDTYEEAYRAKAFDIDKIGSIIFDLVGRITSPADLLELIRIHYRCEDVEFSSGFLDGIQIRMTGNQLIEAFADMQHEFNGDYVMMLRNEVVNKETEKVIGIMDGIHGFEGNVEGNADKILETICNSTKHLYRLDSYEVCTESCTGEIRIKGDMMTDVYF